MDDSHPREAACGIGYVEAQEILPGERLASWPTKSWSASRRASLIDKGEVMGEGFGVVLSPAAFATEIDSGLIQEDVAESPSQKKISIAKTILGL